MRRLVSLVLAGALGAGSGAQAQAAAPPVATAVAAWQVDFGDQRCLAIRRFRVGPTAFTLAIEPDVDGRGARLIFRPEGARVSPGTHRGRVSIDGREVADRMTVWPATSTGVLMMSGFRLDEEEAPLPLAAAQSLTLQSSGLSATVPLSAMAKVAPLLEDCNAGLLESWGFSRADQARMAERPKSRVARFFKPDDYPVASLRSGSQGEVAVRYTVGADGKVSGCTVRMTSGDPALDKATCDVINKRARLVPAKDRSGAAMAMIDTARVRWIFPGF
jgi:TonB family protein